MRKFISFIYLLFFLFITSCSNSNNYYNNKEYEQAIAYVDSISNPKQNDYKVKGLSLYNLNRTEEAKKSLLLAQLMSSDDNKSEEISDILVSYDLSPELNILALENSSGVKSLISLYKSYSKTGNKEKALDLLRNKLINLLSISDFATLIINYPVDESYNLSVLVAWNETLTEEERTSFIDILRSFTRNSMKETSTISTVLKISQAILSSSESDSELSEIYEIIGNCCINLNDKVNAKKYWVASFKLNPDNKYLEEQLIKYD